VIQEVAAVVLAAGQGVRMHSKLPKVLHSLAGRPLVRYAVETAAAVCGQKPIVVVGFEAGQVEAALAGDALCVYQAEQLGTAHAVQQAQVALEGQSNSVVVTYADMPLLRKATLESLVALRASQATAIGMLTVDLADPHGFGRVVRDAAGNIQAVVEEADCTPEQAALRELNAGVYCFESSWLWSHLSRVPVSKKGEYYLTDLVAMAVAEGAGVVGSSVADTSELLGINTRVHLAEAEAVLRQRINHTWMEAGVTIVDPQTTYIEASVRLAPDSTIWPNTYLQGCTVIGSGCEIGPNTQIVDCTIGDACRVYMSVMESSVMEDEADIGPFGHLRKGSRLCHGAHMGNFGEMKNSTLGPGAKMGHFSYLGDASIGTDVNIGCGTITCNFDGVHKHPTVVEDGAFIGSDSMLVAPLHIGKGARTGAGSVVTHDVPDGAIAYGVPARVHRYAPPVDETPQEK
jgi:bifunctional UDP-N-acetylglucosamine pyrophosphorylase / glucosamine-1-phosphate N-acetyltransferase